MHLENSLIDISEKLNVQLWDLIPIAKRLELKGVIKLNKYRIE